LIPGLFGAFAHLPISADSPDLTICAWDSVSTQTPLPLLLDTLVTFIGRNREETLDDQHIIKRYDGDRIRAVFHFGPHILTTMDRQQNRAIYWLNDAATLPYYEKGYPFSRILNWWLQTNAAETGLQLVHAAAVGHATGGVLIPGASGSGKSTTTLACVAAGMQMISDDTCLLQPANPPQVYSLYGTAKLVGETDVERFPSLADIVSNLNRRDDEKALMYFHEQFPDQLANQFPLKAVLLPEITGREETTFEVASRQVVLMALFHSTAAILPHVSQDVMSRLSHALNGLPCYRLRLGTDMGGVATAIEHILSLVDG
jgi:hypothetical protein